MTTKWTPGPWIVGEDPDGAKDCQSIWTAEHGAINAEIAGRICEPANARLIAAAPALAEALAEVVKRALPWLIDTEGDQGRDLDDALHAARAALEAAGWEDGK